MDNKFDIVDGYIYLSKELYKDELWIKKEDISMISYNRCGHTKTKILFNNGKILELEGEQSSQFKKGFLR